MEKEKLANLEKTANELFGENSVVTVATVKLGKKGYITRINMQGLPFEISSMDDTLEKAEELAYDEFEKHMRDVVRNELFPTQPLDRYETVKLTDEEFNRLFKFEDLVGDEYINNLKEKTVVKICELHDGYYECVLESSYMCLHTRGTSGSKKLALLMATMRAHDVLRAPRVYVGRRPWN